MTCDLTAKDLVTILLGTEHAGSTATVYTVSYAVPNSLLGVAQGGNNSGFSFGIVQLDVGVNSFAQTAYTEILTKARSDGVIDQVQFDRLLQYRGESRYDLDPVLSETYRADQALLTGTIFSRQASRDIVDVYNERYVEQSLLGKVQGFLDAVTAAWGTATVFDHDSPDYHQAVSAITSLANRFGNLANTTAHFVATQADSIDDVRSWFNSRLPTTNVADWNLVSIGADLFQAEDTSCDGQDIAFVIDTTGSMFDDIDSVKAQAAAIIDAVFNPARGLENSRIAVVGFNDPTTETILSFTDQPNTDDRKAAALNAINSIVVGGGGDTPELTYTGLLRALDGSAGEWREDAVARKIILFGDAPAKDGALAAQVYALARDLGASIDSGRIAFSTKALSDSVSMTTFDAMVTHAVTGAVTPVPVQIFTVAIGSDSGAASEFEDIATETGGASFTAADASEIVDTLLEVINLPIYSISASALRVAEGDSGTNTVDVIMRRDLVGQAALVTLTLAGTADATDVALSSTSVTFGANETEKVVQVAISGDIEIEPDEGVVVAIGSIDVPATVGTRSVTLTIVNDDSDTPVGTAGDDDIFNPIGVQNIVLGGGADTLRGPVDNFFGDVIDDFGPDDSMVFEGTAIARGSMDVTFGSAIFDVDTNGDGTPNGRFTLEGAFSTGDFMAVVDGGNTVVTFGTLLPNLQEGQAVDPSTVNGIVNQKFLQGDGSTDFKVTLRDLGFAGYDNVVGVYEVDTAGNIVDARIVFGNANGDKSAEAVITGVEAGNSLGFFLVQDAAEWASTLSTGDALSFVTSSGAAAKVFDGAAISLAVNGAVVDEMVFHSFNRDLNSDGLQHALSGVDVGGQAITVGFEDLTGGGDRDYEDVVFRVESVDTLLFA